MMRRQLRRTAPLLALLLWLLAPWAHGADEAAAEAQTPGFAVLSATVSDVDGVVRLDATFALRFGATLEEALHNGVTLPLLVEIEALQERDYYLWSKTIARVEQRYLLSYNALTKQYLLHNLNTDLQFHLPTLSAAKAVLGSLNKFPFLDRNLLREGRQYLARIRVIIDTEQLPAPLRLMSYISSDWDLHSEWYEWPLQLR